MAVVYKNQEIQISSPQAQGHNVVYARPEDIIRLDFNLENVKVTFVNGDVDFIFPDGSTVSLASYSILADSRQAPKIYTRDNRLINFEDLLEEVQVVKPEDAVLVLANRDKSQMTDSTDRVNKVVMASAHDGDLDNGNPITSIGDSVMPTKGVVSNFIDKTGVVPLFNVKNGAGDNIINNNTTFLTGTSEAENILPGNTFLEPQASLTYYFLFGDAGVLGGKSFINGNAADYYAVNFGGGDSKNTESQLQPIDMNNLGGNFNNKIFDAHAHDGIIKRVLRLDYLSGIFPQSIAITGIPTTKDVNGERLFRLSIKSHGTTKIAYNPGDNEYKLTQLDPSGKLDLLFEFQDTVMDQNISMKFLISFFDPKTSEVKLNEVIYDIGIRTVNQPSDLHLNAVVINKGASGLKVNADSAGSGDKIFIAGNIENEFISKTGNNLVFTGGGKDTIKLLGGEKNLIYGSTGYKLITGSGTDNNWLIYSNDKSYNQDFLQSEAIRDNYYDTMKLGNSLNIYLGVARTDVLELWKSLGIYGDIAWLQENPTPNFVKTFNSLTVIGDADGGGSSIANIVGSKGSDTFNLYFNGVHQTVNIFGGSGPIANTIVLKTYKDQVTGNDITINLCSDREGMGRITSKDGQSIYNYESKGFNKIIYKDSDNLTVNVNYDDSANYRLEPLWVTAGDGEANEINFSQLHFTNTANGHIEFDADNRHNLVMYFGVAGERKKTDYFYNFNKIVGSTGRDIFYGNSNSKRYYYNGNSSNNILSYKKSVGGVTFNATDSSIYKINQIDDINNLSQYNQYAKTADKFENVSIVRLSELTNIVVASNDYNIGAENGSYTLVLGNGGNVLRYDLDQSINGIAVYADELKVEKGQGSERYDYYKKGDAPLLDNPTAQDQQKDKRFGNVKYIGTNADDIFYGGTEYISIFDGNGGNNTLSYTNLGRFTSISVDLLQGVVFVNGKQDSYTRINNIVGGAGNDEFTVGNFDPSNPEQVQKILRVNIDGGGGDNSFKFNSTNIQNLDENNYILTYNLNDSTATFYPKKGDKVVLELNLTNNIGTITGTAGDDKFISSADRDFAFDGGGHTEGRYNDPNREQLLSSLRDKGIYGDTLDYSNLDNNLTFNLVDKEVIKGEDRKDTFKNIQGFIGGKGDDNFIVNHTLDDKIRSFDGGSGDNTISYEPLFHEVVFDLVKVKIYFSKDNKNDVNNRIYDVFKNFTTFTGGKGADKFILTYDTPSWVGDNTTDVIKLDGGEGNNELDFSHWKHALGTAENSFNVSRNGSIGASGSMRYEWQNISHFRGTHYGDHFVVTDQDNKFEIDGNEHTGEGRADNNAKNTVDYSQLDSSVNVNVTNGLVNKKDGTVTDKIKNIHNIYLTEADDTVRYSTGDYTGLENLELIDGKGGNNAIDFTLYKEDITAEVKSSGFDLKAKGITTKFINFFTIYASKGNSTFNVTDASDGAKVSIIGNLGVLENKASTLDLTKLTGDIVFYNWSKREVGEDTNRIGLLQWDGGNKQAHIETFNLTRLLLNNANNMIYGSADNHTYYVGGSGTNIIDYSNVNDTIDVTIGKDRHTVKFLLNSGYDYFSNFSKIIGTKLNDSFTVENISYLREGIEYDGDGGENTFSFRNISESMTIDISIGKLQVDQKNITLHNIHNLLLGKADDTVIISNQNMVFKNIDGGGGNNTVRITNGGAAIFNKDARNELVLSNIADSAIILNNFQAITTTTKTGNQFYGSLTLNLAFNVEGSTDEDNNILSYRHTQSLVIFDFSSHEVTKSNGVDKFSGINYFYGSSYTSTFCITKDSKDNFSTIHINANDEPKKDKDIINLSRLGEGAKFYVSQRMAEGGNVRYDWNNIGSIQFINHQTVFASFDEEYQYLWELKGSVKLTDTTLVIDNKNGKNGTTYDGGYVIIDSNNRTIKTFDGSGQFLTSMSFSVINTLVGTGNEKDLFYAGNNNINYQGGLESGKGTLSYQYYATQDGVKFTFNKDNSAVITDSSLEGKRDTAKFISRYVGTVGNDVFVIASNKGQDFIELNGNGGIFNKVDFSQVSGGGGLELDTTQGLPKGEYNYIFKNISTFRLTENDDTVWGSIANQGFVAEGGTSTSIIIDGGGGNNTLDYTKHVKGTRDHINHINVDLHMGVISKVGFINGEEIATSDTIAVADNGTVRINFNKIILSGEYTTNNVIISGGVHDSNDMYISIAIHNITPGLAQQISLENVQEKTNFTWDNDTMSGMIAGRNVTYSGFNNIRLSNSDSTFTIVNPTNMAEEGGVIHGGKGNNTLIMQNSVSTSEASVHLGTNQLTLNNDDKKKYTYTISNFQTFQLGYAVNNVFGADVGNYHISFTNQKSRNTMSYIDLNGSFTKLIFTHISNSGITAEVSKYSISNSSLAGKDVISGMNNIVLTNMDDTVDVKNNDNGPEITIDGGRGINTVSFEASWEGKVDISSLGDNIHVKGYKFINFTKVILTKNDDIITLSETSNFSIDGGGGTNTVDYSQVSGVTFVVQEYEDTIGGSKKMALTINKNGTYEDKLIRFNQLIFKNNSNVTYTATFSRKMANNPDGFFIVIGREDEDDNKNTTIVDYSKINLQQAATEGITINISTFIGNNNVHSLIMVNRGRDNLQDFLKDTIYGMNTIIGTSGKDLVTVSNTTFRYGVPISYLNLNETKSQASIVSKFEKINNHSNEKFLWVLQDYGELQYSFNEGGSRANKQITLLHFTGATEVIANQHDSINVDSEFLIYNFKRSYNITGSAFTTQSKAQSTLNLGNVRANDTIYFDIECPKNNAGLRVNTYSGNASNNNITAKGISYIIGSASTVNHFNLTLVKGSEQNRVYVIKGKQTAFGQQDQLLLQCDNSIGSDTIKLFVASDGLLQIRQQSLHQIDIQHVHNILFGKGNFAFVFNDKSKNVIYNMAKASAEGTNVQMDFSALDVDKVSLDLNNTSYVVNIDKLDIIIKSNSMYDGFLLHPKTSGEILVRQDFKSDVEAHLTGFNIINLSDYISKISSIEIVGDYHNNTINTIVNNLVVDNTKDITINFGLLTKPLTLNLRNLKAINKNVLVESLNTTYQNKITVVAKEFAPDTLYNIDVRDFTKTIFNVQGQTNRIIVENVKRFDLMTRPADWNITFYSNYNYFNGGDGKIGRGLTFDLNLNKLILNFTDFDGKKLGLEGIVTSTPNGKFVHGFLMGFDNNMPAWEKDIGYSSIGGIDYTVYRDTTIFLPKTGVTFEISYGFLDSYIKAARAGEVKKGITIDGSDSYANAISILYSSDVERLLKSSTFYYQLTTGKNQKVDYELYKVVKADGSEGKDLQFKFLGVGSIQGINNTNTSYKVTSADVQLRIQGSILNSDFTKISYGVSNGAKADFKSKPVDITLTPNSTNTVKLDVLGNVGGQTAILNSITEVDFRNITNYSYFKVLLTDTPEGRAQSPAIYAPSQRGDINGARNNIFNLTLLGTQKTKLKIGELGNNNDNTALPAINFFSFNYDGFIKTMQVANFTSFIFGAEKADVDIYDGVCNYMFQKTTTGKNALGQGANLLDLNYHLIPTKFVTTLDLPHYQVVKEQISKQRKFIDKFGVWTNIHIFKAQSNSEGSIDTRALLKFYTDNSNQFTNTRPRRSANDEDHSASNVFLEEGLDAFISFNGVSQNTDKTVVHLAPDLNKLYITAENGIDHYRVFFVNNNGYQDMFGESQTFDTSGYFVIADTNNGHIVYFTGKALDKYSALFQDFLHGQGNIEHVNSYEELEHAIADDSYVTNQYESSYLDNRLENNTASGENGNHAQRFTVIPDDTQDPITIENVVDSIVPHNPDGLNIIEVEDSNDQMLSDINPLDIIDVFNPQEWESLLTEHFGNRQYLETVETDQVLEDISCLNEVDEQVCEPVSIIMTSLDTTIQDDPSTHVEESINKQHSNTVNNQR